MEFYSCWTDWGYEKGSPDDYRMAESLGIRSEWGQDRYKPIVKEKNVLGELLDSRLQWSSQVVNTINKAKRASHAMKLIKPYFMNAELR